MQINIYRLDFFEAWMNYIANTTNVNDPNTNGSAQNESYTYRVKLPRKYSGNLEVTKFEKKS